MNELPRRFKRGDTSLDRPWLLFHRYSYGCELWVTPKRLEEIRILSLAADKKWKKTPKGIITTRLVAHAQSQKPHIKKYRSDYYKRPDVRAKIRQKYDESPETAARREERAKIKADRAAYLESPEGKPEIRKRQNDWIKNNRDKHNITAKKSRLKNPNLAISIKLRNRVRGALRSQPGSLRQFRTEELIGCTIRELVRHLQLQFEEGMTISALMDGRLHIDHITPCALFDLTQPQNQLACFNYRNLRPMWAPENISKSDMIEIDGKLVRGRDLRKKNIIPFQAIA